VFYFLLGAIMSFLASIVLVLAVAASSVAGFTAPDPTNWKVDVGQNGTLTFNPQTINALVGDTVTYYFHPKVSCPC
jgi:plastocyanin